MKREKGKGKSKKRRRKKEKEAICWPRKKEKNSKGMMTVSLMHSSHFIGYFERIFPGIPRYL